jgi:hypothetical protein
MTTTRKLTGGDLLQFTGSEQWQRHSLLREVLYTDGAKYLAEQGGAYWLLDEIALLQTCSTRVAAEKFQLWKLGVNADHTATLTCKDGNGNAVYSKAIEYTDFPMAEVSLYFTNSTILLPNEY